MQDPQPAPPQENEEGARVRVGEPSLIHETDSDQTVPRQDQARLAGTSESNMQMQLISALVNTATDLAAAERARVDGSKPTVTRLMPPR